MQAGMYDEAIKIYSRVYNLDLHQSLPGEAATAGPIR